MASFVQLTLDSGSCTASFDCEESRPLQGVPASPLTATGAARGDATGTKTE